MFKYVTKADVLVVLLLLAGSLLALFYLHRPVEASDEAYVSVQLDGKEIKRLEFSDNAVGQTYRINSKYGYNVLEMGDHRIRAIESSCKEKIHIKQGWISQPGQTLVCLPHKLVVEIKDEATIQNIDHINY